jgi:hypothetical protein
MTLSMLRQLPSASPVAFALVVALAAAGCAAEPAQPFEANVEVAFLDRIDDLEDGDDAILALGFRQGFWYTFNDMTPGASQAPSQLLFTTTPGGPSGKGACARSFGQGFESWGAGMGLDLNDTGESVNGMTKRAPYDASEYKGVAFAARGTGRMRFAVSTAAVESVMGGGTCMGGPANAGCADSHGVDLALTAEWRTYAVPFDRMTQEGFGMPAPFDVKKTMAIHFSVPAGQPFDYAIDDIGFFR